MTHDKPGIDVAWERLPVVNVAGVGNEEIIELV